MDIKDELEIIIAALKSFPDGASLEELHESLSVPIEKRTLQRRLKKLKENNFVYTEGGSHATRYFVKNIDPTLSKTEKLDEPQTIIPLSQVGKDVLALVSRPEIQRTPVGYDRSFLENYRPNIDGSELWE